MNKRRYKVLPLTFPFNCEKDWWEECINEKDKIEPIFNRNGYYYDRKTNKTWLEINGEAWFYSDPEYFLYQLKTSPGNNRIHEDVFKALKTLISYHLADKRIWDLYLTEHDIRTLRQTYVEASLATMKSLKGIEDVSDDQENY